MLYKKYLTGQPPKCEFALTKISGSVLIAMDFGVNGFCVDFIFLSSEILSGFSID